MRSTRQVRTGLAASLLLAACGAPARNTEEPAATSMPRDGALAIVLDPASAPRPTSSAAPSPPMPTASAAVAVAACGAPSFAGRTPHDDDAATTCRFDPPPGADIGASCGTPGSSPPISLDRLDEAVPRFDPATSRHVREVAARGAAMGRRRGVFALVGDSITATPWFMSPFTSPARSTIPDPVLARLRLADGTDVVSFHRAHPASAGLDSFVADRAAKVGAHASYVLPEGTGSAAPLLAVVEQLSPEVAVVLLGSNDATVRFTTLPSLVTTFRGRMTRIVDALEERGVVPVLSTIPRHGREPGRPDCDRSPADQSNWRMAIQVEALSHAVAELACERHLPLVDLRHALDALPNAGLGPDGVHPIAARSGAGDLRPEALACGMNTRNYLTLRALRELRLVLDAP